MKLLLLPLVLLLSIFASAQEIIGKWYSQDSTRIYSIYQKGNHFEAMLSHSSRKQDKKGVIVLSEVMSKKNKKRFEGTIHAVDDGSPTFAKIAFDDKEGNVLRLRLKRMFFLPVTIKWYRVEEKETAGL